MKELSKREKRTSAVLLTFAVSPYPSDASTDLNILVNNAGKSTLH